MALDYGTKRIGVAVGQSVTKTATPIGLVRVVNGNVDWTQLEDFVQTWSPDAFVLGLPIDKEGSRQILTELAEAFGAAVEERFGKQVFWMDERFSSQAANALLVSMPQTKLKKKKQSLNKDSLAAALILESWFNQS